MNDQDESQSTSRRRSATIIDVANAADVAIGTVSRYLNGQAVRSSNRDQIERAIAHLGYQRNALAAAMKRDLTNMVGFLLPSLTEYHSSILQLLSRKMRQHGKAVISYFHDTDSRSIREGIAFFVSHRVDCLVMDGLAGQEEPIRSLIEQQIPVVLYDNDIPALAVDRVFVQNRNASYRAVSHLLDIGHTRIGLIAGLSRDYTCLERLAGYTQAHQERGIEIDPDFIVEGAWIEQGGHNAMRQMMSLDTPPTAVFSCNYNMTVGALNLFKELGLRLTDGPSLVSFDDVPLFRLHETGITAIAQPTELIADTIAGLLLTRLNNRTSHAPPASIMLDCDIILRGSTRKMTPRLAID